MSERTHGSMAPSASTTAIHDMNMADGTFGISSGREATPKIIEGRRCLLSALSTQRAATHQPLQRRRRMAGRRPRPLFGPGLGAVGQWGRKQPRRLSLIRYLGRCASVGRPKAHLCPKKKIEVRTKKKVGYSNGFWLGRIRPGPIFFFCFCCF